jgi:hypothetical protein
MVTSLTGLAHERDLDEHLVGVAKVAVTEGSL